MRIIKTELPPNSLLFDKSKTYDYIDSYTLLTSSLSQETTATEIARLLFSKRILWIDGLFSIRNKIMSFLGFEAPDRNNTNQEQLNSKSLSKGDKLEFFTVFDSINEELILGDDDSHLDFRVSILFDSFRSGMQQSVTLSTYVIYKNRFGRVYFFLIRPFHIAIVKTLLRRFEKMVVVKKENK